jgi:thiaminase/transcriptional activator TenA
VSGTTVGTAEQAWRSVAPWYEAILAHPFVAGLRDATLPPEAFVRYLVDDAHYLERYARVLARLAEQAPDAEAVALLASAAAGAVAAERSLHTGELADRGVVVDDREPSPTCRAYTGFLAEAAAREPFEVGLAAVLPCFRVYAEVGRTVHAGRPAGAHPYAAWIETYADPAFDAAVDAVERLLDRVAPGPSDAVLRAYGTATRFEWMFWDAAWRGESWPEPAGS